MADISLLRDGEPFAPPFLEEASDFVVEVCAHRGPNIAKFCYMDKQYFACEGHETHSMGQNSINVIFATNLRRRMEAAGLSQLSLGKKAGLAQRSIGNYLEPDKRALGAKGKEPSAKLTEMAMIAQSLGLEPWEMLIPESFENDAAVEKQAVELVALFRGMPAGAQSALLEQARLVHKATKVDDSTARRRSADPLGELAA